MENESKLKELTSSDWEKLATYIRDYSCGCFYSNFSGESLKKDIIAEPKKTYIMNVYGYELRCPVKASNEEEAFKEFEKLIEIQEVDK